MTTLESIATGVRARQLVALTCLAAATACGPGAKLPLSAGIGPSPELPSPKSSLIPTVKVADAKGWSANEKPTASRGLVVTAFARGLDHPRSIYVLPNGDVLVAETNAPADRPDNDKGIKAWFFRHYQKKAGAGVPSANRGGMFVAQHGSWNRKPFSGYRVIFVAFAHGRPTGEPIEVLTDFLDSRGNARGRPVSVAIDRRGALLVADDVGNTIWRVTAAP